MLQKEVRSSDCTWEVPSFAKGERRCVRAEDVSGFEGRGAIVVIKFEAHLQPPEGDALLFLAVDISLPSSVIPVPLTIP